MSVILLLADGANGASEIRVSLESEGFEVTSEEDRQRAISLLRRSPFDLVILNLGRFGGEGFQVLKDVRTADGRIPVLITTARTDEASRILGFRLGADQYLTRPFGPAELAERSRALIRRARARRDGSGGAPNRHEFGDLVVDLAARTVSKSSEEVSLPPKAFDLLAALMASEGRVVSRHRLLRDVWGHRASVVTRTVDTHISELRRALEDDSRRPRHILTVRKRGYRFQR